MSLSFHWINEPDSSSLLVFVGEVLESVNDDIECSIWCSDMGFIFVLECAYRSML